LITKLNRTFLTGVRDGIVLGSEWTD